MGERMTQCGLGPCTFQKDSCHARECGRETTQPGRAVGRWQGVGKAVSASAVGGTVSKWRARRGGACKLRRTGSLGDCWRSDCRVSLFEAQLLEGACVVGRAVVGLLVSVGRAKRAA